MEMAKMKWRVKDEVTWEDGQARHPRGRGERQRHIVSLDLCDA